jgi:peptidoglycan hydrolase-like protein with peptidoglycan-binding domain
MSKDNTGWWIGGGLLALYVLNTSTPASSEGMGELNGQVYSPAVQDMQHKLNLLPSNYPRLIEDGLFGPATTQRVIEFQISAGLNPDGSGDAWMMAALNNAIAGRSQSPANVPPSGAGAGNQAGTPPPSAQGLGAWWAKRTTTEKELLGGGAALLVVVLAASLGD